MKKRLSWVLALSLAASMLPGMLAHADYNLTLGKTETFDDLTKVEGNDIVDVGGIHGSVMKIRPETHHNIFMMKDSPFNPTDGKTAHVSFDLNMSEGSKISFYCSPGNGNEGILTFNNGKINWCDYFGTWAEDISIVPTKEYNPGEWMKVDILIDTTEFTKTYYIDGVLLGIQEFKNNPNNANPETKKTGTGIFDNFRIYCIKNENASELAYLDNLSISVYEGGEFSAETSIDGQNMTINFNSTVKGKLTEDNFTITKASNALNLDAQPIDFELVSSDSSSALLKLAEVPEAGNTVTVKVNNVTAFTGDKLANDTFTTPITKLVTTTATDDMSEVKGNWEGHTGILPTAADGKVTATDIRNYYYFDNVYSGGIITLEMKVNCKTTGAPFISGIDADGDTYYLAQIESSQICYHKVPTPGKKTGLGQAYYKSETAGQGQDMELKWEIDTSTHLVKAYVNGDYVVEMYPYNSDLKNAGLFDSLKGVFFHGDNWVLDEITVTQTKTEPAINNVSFIDIEGNATTADRASALTDTIAITFSDGLYGDAANGTIEIVKGEDTVAYTSSYDKDTKTLNLELDSILGAKNTYDINISGVKTENGTEYDELKGTLTTMDGESYIGNVRVNKAAKAINVAVDYVNVTNDTASYYVVCTAYDGNEMKSIQYTKMDIKAGEAEFNKVFTFKDEDAKSYEKVAAYIWKSFENIMPITKSAVK